MTYLIEGRDVLQPVNLAKLLRKPGTASVLKTEAVRSVVGKKKESYRQKQYPDQSYTAVERISRSPTVLKAQQIMTTPVYTLFSNAKIADALQLFEKYNIRHIPILSQDNSLAGIISDRNLYQYCSGITYDGNQNAVHRTDEDISSFMVTRVLTATPDSDVRDIARIFVEQNIGSMPITENRQLKGIIARSDVLGAVMLHYSLELWG